MRLQPRQQLLEIWRSTAQTSYVKGKWIWGGRTGTNSISDAEQLLCILRPATELNRFRLERPNETDESLLQALRPLGGALDIPLVLVRALTEYMERYTLPDGTPDFSGGSEFMSLDPGIEPTLEQAGLETVESFAISVTLTLAALGFAKTFMAELSRDDLRAAVRNLGVQASKRLTAAMVGLLRSYSVNVFRAPDMNGQQLLRMVNQSGVPERRAAEDLRLELIETAAGLRDLTTGSGQVGSDLDVDNLFECGWSWGIVKDAPPLLIDFDVSAGKQMPGYAYDSPYLYFTVVALDGIAELFADRTRLLGLLNEEQQRLATALQLRWDLTQNYWATIASFGAGRWPLEDIPWRTTDGQESDLFSLLVASIAARSLSQRRGTDTDLSRLGRILAELASRSRINRRPFGGDPALALHHPGVCIQLEGSESFGPQLGWMISDVAPMMLRRTIMIAGLINQIELRGQLMELVDEIWDHIDRRRLRTGIGRDLWDQPNHIFQEITVRFEQPSWHSTLRVVESLVVAANLIESHPLRSDNLLSTASDLLAEAAHLYDQELFVYGFEGGNSLRAMLHSVSDRIERAREIMPNRPGSAVSLLLDVLQELDRLAAIRQRIETA